ncbi:hypothetical protein Esi_0149_0082 [Ectocarpus siliculosus]|uniref:Uncharacterized protein n=1 Tax=Ectocarpus siliculosus TaxID=2880 RepID=D7FKX8_ECTSI|nr:hypothetical protein Esi_0149_0082 [Ectocarpus siliculosus]|eukprot:CBJ29523.1 hypothetical protein Esi_0149_0082 [Ectocarpus siliculosus]
MSAAFPEFDEVWRWDGWTTLDEHTNDGAVDLDGNVVLVGSQGYAAAEDLLDDTFVDAYSGDFAAVKLEGASGEVLWTWTASSLGSEADMFLAVDTDSNNDIVMGGRTEGYWSSSNPDSVAHIAVVKLDGGTGDEIWRYQEHPPDSYTSLGSYFYYGYGSVSGVAVDGDDNCLLVGQTYGSLVYGEGDPGDSDFFVIKLDGTDGSEIWTVQGGESASFDSLHHVKVDSGGDLIVVGIGGDEDAVNVVVVKFSGTDGAVLWEYSPVTSSTHDVPASVDVDTQDDVYIAGGYDALNLQGTLAETPVVLKLDGATGDVVWTYEGVATSSAGFRSVAVDLTTGWVVGAGWTTGTWLTGAAQGGYDFAAVVLDGVTGDELGRYQDGTTDDDSLKFVGFDSVGGLILGGSWTDTGEAEFVAIKFAPFELVAPTPAPTLPPTLAPTLARTPAPTVAPVTLAPMTTPSPLAISADAGDPTPAPFQLNQPPQTTESPVGRGLTTPAPTTSAAAAAVLSEWEIAAIAGGGSFLLLLLGLCLFCFRRKRPEGQQGAAKGASRPLPVEGFGGLSVQGEILQPRPPVKASGVAEFAPPAPPAPKTPLPPPAEPPLPPPPAYNSPPLPPPEVVATETEEVPPPPPYEEMNAPEPAAAPAEAPWERLAKRVARVPSKKAFEQNYRNISVSQYAPYAPSTTNR